MLKTYTQRKTLVLFFFVLISANHRAYSQEDSIRIYIQKSKDYLFENKNTSLAYLEKAEKLLKNSSDTSLEYEIAYSKGTVHYVSADYDLALENFLFAMDGFEDLNDDAQLAKCITGLGLVEMGLENYHSSIHYFQKASKIKTEKQEYMNAANYFNLGIAHMEIKQLDSSAIYLNKSLELSIKHKRSRTQHMVLNRFAELMLIQNLPDSAKVYFDALKNHPEPMNTWELTFLNRMLAEYYMVKDEWNKADEYANASLQLAQKIPSKWEIFKCYEILSKVQKSKGNYKKAFEYLELHNTYKDSVIDENVVRKIKYLQLQKKENENELLKMDNASIEKQLKNSKTITYLSLIVSVLFLIALYLMFNYAKTKNSLSKKLKLSNENIANQNESLENLNELKNRLLSTLSHDFRSPLVAIEQVLKLFKEKILDRQERDELLEKLHPQVVETIGMVNNMVYWAQNQLKSSLSTKELINLNEVLKEVIKNVKLNCELKNISIQFSEIEIPDIVSDKTHLQIIFQNLLGNAIKFSNTNQKIKIFTELTKTEIRVHFKDFGSGLNQEEIDLILHSVTAMPSKLGTYNESGTGLGMLLVKQLLKKESGKLEIRSTPQKGSDFIVCLPLKSENEIE